MAEVMILNKQHPLYKEDLDNILKTDGIKALRGKRFLITGSTGLLGVCLIDALMHYNKQGADITIYALGRNKEKASARLGEYYNDGHFHFVEQDVREPLPDSLKVDYIIPLASNTHPLAYAQYPIETIEINAKGAEYALQKAVECEATVLYPSTVEVYGNAKGEDVFTEDYTGQLNLSTSRSCYTESKRLSESLCQSYISEKEVPSLFNDSKSSNIAASADKKEKKVYKTKASGNSEGTCPQCPECGEMLEFAEGCVVCKSCGYSKCF